MNWDDLKIALAIARAGSMSRAADLLGMDQSTVGRRLAALEAALGEVFIRAGEDRHDPNRTGRSGGGARD